MEHSGGMVPFICYYRKVRSSICISQKPYNGKRKLHWTYNAIKTNKQKKQAHYSLRAQLFQPLCDPSGNNWKKKKKIRLLFHRLTAQWQNKLHRTDVIRGTSEHEWMQITTTKAQFQRRHLGTRLAPPTRERRNLEPKFRQILGNPKHLRADRWESDCGSHVNCRDHQISQFLPTLLSSPRWSVTKHDVRRCGACVPDRV